MEKTREHVIGWVSSPFIILLGLTLIWSGFLQSTSMSQEGDSLKVGVVDIREVYSSYDRAEDFTEKIKQKKSEAEEKIQKATDKLKQIEKELNELEPLSELWKKRAKKFYQLKSERKMMQDLWKQDTKKLLGETSAEIYRTISDVVDTYGNENNFDLILKVNKAPLGEQQASDINQQIASRSVLHFKNEMDLTDKIIEILNKRYENQQSGSESEESGN